MTRGSRRQRRDALDLRQLRRQVERVLVAAVGLLLHRRALGKEEGGLELRQAVVAGERPVLVPAAVADAAAVGERPGAVRRLLVGR